MTDYKQNSSSPTRLYNLSPEKYGKTAFKQLSYTPDKLYENVLYKEITVNKKIEFEKKKIRELESENTICNEKIKQLQTEIQTVRKSLLLQIEMYKQMLTNQEEQKSKHIKSIQYNFNLEIEKILSEHEQDSKVAQAQKQQLQAKIQELLDKLESTEYQLHNSNTEGEQLNSKLQLTTQKLQNTQQKLQKSEELNKLNSERAANQIKSLNDRLQKQRLNFRNQLESTINEKNRQIQNNQKLHIAQVQKLENKKNAEISQKILECKQLTTTFEAQGRRLDQIINNKDRINTNLTTDLNKQKQRVLALTKHYQNQLNQLLNQKGHLIIDLQNTQKQRNHYKINTQQLALDLDQQRNKSSALIASLQNELTHKTGQLFRQNQNLVRTIDQFEQQVNFLRNENRQIQHQRHIDTTKVKMTSEHYSEQNRQLLLQIKNLRDVLLESSLQMQKCKQEFIRMDHERERLLRLSKDYEQQNIRFKAILSQRQLQVRQWRDNYFGLKARY